MTDHTSPFCTVFFFKKGWQYVKVSQTISGSLLQSMPFKLFINIVLSFSLALLPSPVVRRSARSKTVSWTSAQNYRTDGKKKIHKKTSARLSCMREFTQTRGISMREYPRILVSVCARILV
jgi:hypothetical protein